VSGKVVNKSADEYDLDFERFESGEKNINYDGNQNTKFKTLIDQMTTLTIALDRIKENN
jgi:hypothetical protein